MLTKVPSVAPHLSILFFCPASGASTDNEVPPPPPRTLCAAQAGPSSTLLTSFSPRFYFFISPLLCLQRTSADSSSLCFVNPQRVRQSQSLFKWNNDSELTLKRTENIEKQ